jgi:hypothetical protein
VSRHTQLNHVFGSRPSFRSHHGNEDRLFLECVGLDCVFPEDGGGSEYLKGRVALAPDPVLKMLGGLLRTMFLIGLDPALRDWWLSRLVNASWLGVSSASMSGQLRVFLFSGDVGALCLIVAVMVGCNSLSGCISLCYIACICTNYIS